MGTHNSNTHLNGSVKPVEAEKAAAEALAAKPRLTTLEQANLMRLRWAMDGRGKQVRLT